MKSYVKHVASITEYRGKKTQKKKKKREKEKKREKKKNNAISNSTDRHIGDTIYIYPHIFLDVKAFFSERVTRRVILPAKKEFKRIVANFSNYRRIVCII